MNTRLNTRASGFTLIELLVVISIIGLLSSTVLTSLNSARIKARDARRVADIRQIQNALELYASDHNGQYPNISVTICESNLSWHASLQTALAPYLPKIPVAPNSAGDGGSSDCSGWGTRYVVGSTLTDYKVVAHLPENPTAISRSLWDPRRDSGADNSTGWGIVDGTSPWAIAVYTPGLASW